MTGIQTATSIELYEYWTRLRGGESVPMRRDFEPGVLRHALPMLFMLECGGEGEAVFRLAGTAICDAFGGEQRGLSFSYLWQRNERPPIISLLARVTRQCDPLLLQAHDNRYSGQPVLLEIMLVPLRSQSGLCDRILGSMTHLLPLRRETEAGTGSLELKQAAAVRMAANGTPFTLPLGDLGAIPPQRLLQRLSRGFQDIAWPGQRQRAPVV